MAKKKGTVLDGLNLVDKFLFDKTIENKEAFEAVASIVTSESVVLKEAPHVEKEEGVSPELRAIRLDVVGFSEAERLYRYTFEGVCRECPDLKLNDGALRIFINSKGKNRDDFTQEFLDFCDYITESTDEVANRSKSEKVKLIHEFVSKIRRSEKMGVKYMQKWEELAYAKEEGMQQGIEQGILRHIYQLVERGKYSVQEALEDLQGTLSESEFIEGMLASGYKLP